MSPTKTTEPEEVETVVYADRPDIGPPPATWDDDAETFVDTPEVVEVDPGAPADPDRPTIEAVKTAVDAHNDDIDNLYLILLEALYS